MFHSKLVPVATVAVIALCTTGTVLAKSDERGLGREIADVADAKISPTQAITTAERTTDGHAMRIAIEKDNGAYVYKVRTVSKGKVSNVFVDSTSGQVVRTENQNLFVRLFDWDDANESASLEVSSTTLMAAIGAAERKVGGTAIEAKYRYDDHAARFDVRVAKDSIVYQVRVDPATGRVISGQADGRGDHGDD